MTTGSLTHNDLLSNPAFHVHLTKAATLAQTCLASDNGRISRAVDLVLAGCVEALGCGRWEVASATSFPERWYRVYNGGCTCPDYVAHAHLVPNHCCQHVIAVGLFQKATQEMEREHMQYEVPEPTREEMDAMVEAENARLEKENTCSLPIDEDGVPCYVVNPDCPHTDADYGCVCAAPAPEDTDTIIDNEPEPCEATYALTIAGREVRFTLRDTNDVRLTERVEAMIRHFDGCDCADDNPIVVDVN